MTGMPARTYLARRYTFSVQLGCDCGIGGATFPQCLYTVEDRSLAIVVAVWLPALAAVVIGSGFSCDPAPPSTW